MNGIHIIVIVILLSFDFGLIGIHSFVQFKIDQSSEQPKPPKPVITTGQGTGTTGNNTVQGDPPFALPVDPSPPPEEMVIPAEETSEPDKDSRGVGTGVPSLPQPPPKIPPLEETNEFPAVRAVANTGKSASCSYKYRKVGCYKDKNSKRAFKELVFTDRDPQSPVFSEIRVGWGHWTAYLDDIVCRCAMESYHAGYKMFSIQNFGECWSDSDTNTLNIHGLTDRCVTYGYAQCDLSNDPCAGKGNTNYVYTTGV